VVSTLSFSQSPEQFFGMHINNHKDFGSWPDIPFGGLRLHDSGVAWREIEVSPHKYDWTTLDRHLKRAKEHHVDVMYAFTRTPEFYAEHSQCRQEFRNGACEPDRCAEYGGKNRAGCFPPDDLGREGGGSDEHFKSFVSAIVDHVASLDHNEYATISSWEIWNEYDNDPFWEGTDQQLLRMSKDAYAIIKAKTPNAIVTTPNAILPRFLRIYLQQPGAAEVADAISLHAYIPHCSPEEFIEKRLQIMHELQGQFMPGKPIYLTEGSWAKEKNCPDLEQQAAFAARYMLLFYAGIGKMPGVDRLWWYGYDYPAGRLSDPDTGALRPAGKAYGEMYRWLVSNTLVPHSCKADGTRWSCQLKSRDGEAMIVWDADPGKELGGGAGAQSGSFNAPSKFSAYRMLDGSKQAASSGVPLGPKPVLLETSKDTK
jgi:hypothetical protein